MRRTRFEASIDKKRAVKKAEEQGLVADSLDVRKQLMDKVHNGDITLEEAQAELARIKRGAKADGKLTRSQAFNRG